MLQGEAELKIDGNLGVADFEKMQNNTLSHIGFEALDNFRKKLSKMPGKARLIKGTIREKQ